METGNSRDKEDTQWRYGLKGQGYSMETGDSRDEDTQWRQGTRGTRRILNEDRGLRDKEDTQCRQIIPFIHQYTKDTFADSVYFVRSS